MFFFFFGCCSWVFFCFSVVVVFFFFFFVLFFFVFVFLCVFCFLFLPLFTREGTFVISGLLFYSTCLRKMLTLKKKEFAPIESFFFSFQSRPLS